MRSVDKLDDLSLFAFRLTPREIVQELDKYIVGQTKAKRAVAVALRNRYRRSLLAKDLRDEISPKNILMIGPTGVGKTEIARRLAKLVRAPFLKVEATKYTEVGYVGKDVESMIRELVEIAVNMVKQEEKEKVRERAQSMAEERLLDLLVPMPHAEPEQTGLGPNVSTRDKFRQLLREGALNDREVTLETKEQTGPQFEVLAIPGLENMDFNIRDMLGQMMPKKSRKRKVKVPEALELLTHEEASRLVDMDKVVPLALDRASQHGIIFLDEMDKIAESSQNHKSGGVSREGVQRDLLPIVEGSTVNTKYGPVNTGPILFIGAGAFHHSKPSDLFPELQGRFPIRVELSSLTTEDFVRILEEPAHSLIKQYTELLATEGVRLEFQKEAIQTIGELATQVNDKTENIGARRLHTLLEKILEELSFAAPEIAGETVVVTSHYVKERVQDLTQNDDLTRYML